MAENESSSGWWNGWIQTAKEKSVSALEFVKKDLSEFTSTMQHDTTVVASEVKSKINPDNARAATKKAKEGVTQLFGGLSKALTVEDDGQHKRRTTTSYNKNIFDRAQARLNAIQVDPGTYCEEPIGPREDFEEWLQAFNLEKQKGDISELLVINVEVRALYTQLVPSKVSHADFWQRYFYKLHQLNLDENRKAALKKRADDVQEQVGWDDDDDWGDLDGPSSPPKQGGMHLVAKSLADTTENDIDTVSPESNNGANSVISSKADSNIDQQVQREDMKENQISVTNSELVTPSDLTSQQESQVQSSARVNKVSDNEDNLVRKEGEEVATSQSEEGDSSLSISSITDISSPEDGKKQMESSADTLTLVSPLDEVAVDISGKNSDKANENDRVTISDIPSDSVKENVISECVSAEEKEIKTRVKGEMVVVGSGASSERTTPSSTVSGNKESEDDWEKEFEVTEDDLVQHTTDKLKLDALTNEMEDDWESWD